MKARLTDIAQTGLEESIKFTKNLPKNSFRLLEYVCALPTALRHTFVKEDKDDYAQEDPKQRRMAYVAIGLFTWTGIYAGGLSCLFLDGVYKACIGNNSPITLTDLPFLTPVISNILSGGYECLRKKAIENKLDKEIELAIK